MNIFRDRPALVLASLGALFGIWNIIMGMIYHVSPNIEAVRYSLVATVMFIVIDIISEILKDYMGG